MSRSQFLDAAGDYADWRRKNNLPEQHYLQYFAGARDIWMKDEKYKGLISFILEEWDSGNCDEFSQPLSEHLILKGELQYFKQLWKGIIRNRLNKLWGDYDHLKHFRPNFGSDRINKVNIEGYNQFSAEEPIERSIAWRRQYIIDGILEFMLGLAKLNDKEEIQRQKTLIEVVKNLEKPKPKPSTDKRKIDEKLFWEIISDNRIKSENQSEFIENLKSTLESFQPKEMRSFDKILLTKISELNTWEMWALVYIVRKGCGDDGFDYFKAWAVSTGKENFEAIKNLDEGRLLDLFDEDPQLEEMYYVAQEVYEDKTSDLMKPVRIKASKITGKKWEEDNLPETYPTLCKLFGFN
jgi:hypothetical protein